MMDKITWKKWLSDWNWILEIAKRRNWDYDSLIIKPTINIDEINKIEDEFQIKYPLEFKAVLTTFSSGVLFNWQIENEKTEGEFRQIFRGCGGGYLWDIETLRSDFENYIGPVQACFPDINDEYDKIWHNKVPFLDVPNGDMIVFDTSERQENCPIIYLSHDGSEFHGSRLAENFIEFISRWSNLGCVGTEDWQFEPFYDYDKEMIKNSDPIINRWKNWLEKQS
jgi:SMI1 / KNR4 family (SUKH-1)